MIQLAIQTAVEHHEGQKRKGTNIPYIVHPIEVGIILTENGSNEEVITAGILHDTLEDTKLTYDDIKNKFNENVAKLVLSATETNRNVEGITWKERKEHTINSIREASFESCLIICADKLSNIRSIKKDYYEIGNGLWDRFNAGYDDQKWYYQSLVANLSNSSISHLKVYKEFNSIVKEIFGEIPAFLFIKDNLYSYDSRISFCVTHDFSSKDYIVKGLAKVIKHYRIIEDNGIEEEIKNVLDKIMKINGKYHNEEEVEIDKNTIENIVRVYYVLSDFLFYNSEWVLKNVGDGFLSYYELFDDDL